MNFGKLGTCVLVFYTPLDNKNPVFLVLKKRHRHGKCDQKKEMNEIGWLVYRRYRQTFFLPLNGLPLFTFGTIVFTVFTIRYGRSMSTIIHKIWSQIVVDNKTVACIMYYFLCFITKVVNTVNPMHACQIGPTDTAPLAWDRLTGPVSGQGGTLWTKQPFCSHFSTLYSLV